MPWFLIFDGFLIVLLLATIVCAFSLSRRLSLLRSDRNNLEKLMEQFKIITDKADSSLSGLRAAAEDVSRELRDATEASRAMRDELAFLVDRADRSAEKLAAPIDRDRFDDHESDQYNFEGDLISEERDDREGVLDYAGAQADKNIRDHLQSEAEQDLVKALRRVR